MEYYKTDHLSQVESQSVFGIWNSVFPRQVSHETLADFEEYLGRCTDPVHYLARSGGEIAGWLCAFSRDDERWLALLVAEKFQGQGVGSELLKQMKGDESEINGWIVTHDDYFRLDGSVYISPQQFYKANGFYMTGEKFKNGDLVTTKIRWSSQGAKVSKDLS